MPGRSVRIGRIAGIPVGISPWWFAMVAVIAWSLGDSYFPEEVPGIAPAAAYALGLASALLLFASILAHEFGHALVARRHGIEVEEIDLWLLGGVSRMRGEAHAPGDELRYALAGPAVTAVIAVVFGAAALLLPSGTPAVVSALITYQALINAAVLFFNLMPAFPLDGGRVLRALLWRRSGDVARASRIAARLGRSFGWVMVFLGGLELVSGVPAGLWLALVGVFLVSVAEAEARVAEVEAVLTGVSARELMSSPAICVPADVSVERAVSDWFVPYRCAAFPVVDRSGRALGLIGAAEVQKLPAGAAATQPVSELADRDPGLMLGEGADLGRLIERPAFARAGHVVVLDAAGLPAGVISMSDVQRAMRAARLAPRVPGAHAPAGL